MARDKVKEFMRRKNLTPIVIAIVFIVLLMPTFVRFYSGNHSLIGTESYYHKEAASKLLETGSLNPFNPPKNVKETVYTSRNYHFTPHDYLMVYSTKFITLEAASRVLPLILGLLSLAVFGLILTKIIEERYKRTIIMILLVINPAFIYTFTVSNPNATAILFSLLGIYFFMKEKKANIIPAVLCLSIVALFGLFNIILAMLAILAYVMTRKGLLNRLIVITSAIAIITFTQKINFYYSYTYAPQINILGNLISDLGGLIGFGIFMIILAIYGIYHHWDKKQLFMGYFLLAIALALSLFYVGNIVNSYLVFLVAIAAGYGIINLLNANWDVRTIKNLTLLIIACGLIFSTVSYMTRTASMEPEQGMTDALIWMRGHVPKDGRILTYYSNGYLVTSIAKHPTVADSYLDSKYNQKFMYKVEDSIFYSRDLEEVKKLFAAYGIKYIIIDKNMKERLVWTKENEGLLFLFTSKKTFQEIYDKKGVEIWKVKDMDPTSS